MFQDVHLHNEKHALFSNAAKALRPVYTCDFSCDVDAILRTKFATAYPARVVSRV